MCEWIDIKKQLPGEEGIYICYVKNQGVKMCSYAAHVYGSRKRWWYKEYEQARRVTHWMKLEDPT